MPPRKRRYGEGSVTQLASGKWRGVVQTGYTVTGGRATKSITGDTEAEAHKKLDKLVAQIRINGVGDAKSGTTVKAWADDWLDQKVDQVRPETFKGYRTAVTRWIVPGIGKKRLADLTPGDIRRVSKAVLDAGRSTTTARLQMVILRMMLNDAVSEGHNIATSCLRVKMPGIARNDRTALPVAHSDAIMKVIANRPDRARWLIQIVYGIRQGEALGLTWPYVDFERGSIEIRWQLRPLPWADRAAGTFRIPHGLDYIRLHGAMCLTPPKSKAGFRLLPLLPMVSEALLDLPRIGELGLVFPRPDGLPQDSHEDLDTWHAIQDLADVRHPTGRYYHTHEIRHTAATSMMRMGIDSATQIQLMGHSTMTTTAAYQHADLAIKRAALERLELG